MAGPYYRVSAPDRPNALFFPDSSLLLKYADPADEAVINAAFPAPAASIALTTAAQFDTLTITCQTGSQ